MLKKTGIMTVFLLGLMCSIAVTQEINVITETWEPYNFVKNGRVVGLSTEIVELTLQKAGLTIKNGKIDVYPWARAYRIALNDRNVLLYTILRTEEREGLFKWVGPLVPPETFYFYKHRTRTDVVVNTLDDAKKYKIGVLRDTVLEDFLNKHGFSRQLIDPVSDHVFNLKKLLADRIDLIMDVESSLKIRTSEQGLPLSEFEQGLYLFDHGYYMAFSLNTSDEIVERARAAFREVQASGIIETLQKKYTSSSGETNSPAGNIRVTFINPDRNGNPFWDNVTRFMQAVANDLNIQLHVQYADANRYQAARLAKESIQATPKPDYLIFVYQYGQGLNILREAEKAKVRSFIINTDTSDKNRLTAGAPREKFSYWIGHMFPDDVRAGYELAMQLIEEGRIKINLNRDEHIHMVALSGSRDSSPALDRNMGLKLALQTNPDVTLHQLVFSEWDSQVALQKTSGLLSRYPETTLIWSASDAIALGVVEAIAGKHKIPGNDIFTGGIDWTEKGVTAVHDRKLLTTMGGHFMEGGWALILLNDYHHGIDFSSLGTTIRYRMQAITRKNVQTYLKTLERQNWDAFDFRQHSKAFNPQLKEYDFSLNALLKSDKKQ